MNALPWIRKSAWPAFVLLLALGEIAWCLAPPPRAWVERWYSQGLFPWIASWLVPAVGGVPFSLSIFGLVFVSILILVGAARGWRRRRRIGERALRVLAVGARSLIVVSVLIYAAFLIPWGAGYGRERLETRLELGKDAPLAAEVSRWTARLAERIASHLPEPDARSGELALASLQESLESTLQAWNGGTPALPRGVKSLPPGSLLSFGTSGLTVPFFLEPHVDAGLHETEWLTVATHELAHVAGYCAEADADFAAAVAGLNARDSYAKYSVELWLFQKFAAELPEGESRKAHESLPELAREDIAAARKAHSKHRIESFARLQSRVYDAYLRSQRLEEGLREYSIVVRLLVQAERKGIVKL